MALPQYDFSGLDPEVYSRWRSLDQLGADGRLTTQSGDWGMDTGYWAGTDWMSTANWGSDWDAQRALARQRSDAYFGELGQQYSGNPLVSSFLNSAERYRVAENAAFSPHPIFQTGQVDPLQQYLMEAAYAFEAKGGNGWDSPDIQKYGISDPNLIPAEYRDAAAKYHEMEKNKPSFFSGLVGELGKLAGFFGPMFGLTMGLNALMPALGVGGSSSAAAGSLAMPSDLGTSAINNALSTWQAEQALSMNSLYGPVGTVDSLGSSLYGGLNNATVNLANSAQWLGANGLPLGADLSIINSLSPNLSGWDTMTRPIQTGNPSLDMALNNQVVDLSNSAQTINRPATNEFPFRELLDTGKSAYDILSMIGGQPTLDSTGYVPEVTDETGLDNLSIFRSAKNGRSGPGLGGFASFNVGNPGLFVPSGA